MKKTILASILLTVAVASTMIVLDADEADGAITQLTYVDDGGKTQKLYYIDPEYGVKYDLCEDDSDYYGVGKHVAFVTGGNNEGVNTNCKLTGPTIRIKSVITANYENSEGETVEGTFTVVGIRNNAFQASLTAERCTASIETVYIPETMVAIGVATDYTYSDDNGGVCFSGCNGLKEIIFEGTNPQIKHISKMAFKEIGQGTDDGTAIDLSECTGLDIAWGAFAGAKISFIDLSSAKKIEFVAFINSISGGTVIYSTGIQSIIMPAKSEDNTDPRIDDGAFDGNGDKGLKFYDLNGDEVRGNDLVDKAFKLASDGKMRQAFVATFDTDGGEPVPKGVYFVDEVLPLGEKDGHFYLEWAYDDSGETKKTRVMPQQNTKFTIPEDANKVTVDFKSIEGTDVSISVNGDAFIPIGPGKYKVDMNVPVVLELTPTGTPVMVAVTDNGAVHKLADGDDYTFATNEDHEISIKAIPDADPEPETWTVEFLEVTDVDVYYTIDSCTKTLITDTSRPLNAMMDSSVILTLETATGDIYVVDSYSTTVIETVTDSPGLYDLEKNENHTLMISTELRHMVTVTADAGLSVSYALGDGEKEPWSGPISVRDGTVVTFTVEGLTEDPNGNDNMLKVVDTGKTSYKVASSGVATYTVTVLGSCSIEFNDIAPAPKLSIALGTGLSATYSVGGSNLGPWPGSFYAETGTTVFLTISGFDPSTEKLEIAENGEVHYSTDSVLSFTMNGDRTVSIEKVEEKPAPEPSDPSKYNVVIYLDANGGSVSPTIVSFLYGTTMKAANIPMPTYDGMDFHGWYVGDTPVGPDYVFKRSTTLVAHWTEIVDPEPIPGPMPDVDPIKESNNNWLLIALLVLAAILAITACYWMYRSRQGSS